MQESCRPCHTSLSNVTATERRSVSFHFKIMMNMYKGVSYKTTVKIKMYSTHCLSNGTPHKIQIELTIIDFSSAPTREAAHLPFHKAFLRILDAIAHSLHAYTFFKQNNQIHKTYNQLITYTCFKSSCFETSRGVICTCYSISYTVFIAF